MWQLCINNDFYVLVFFNPSRCSYLSRKKQVVIFYPIWSFFVLCCCKKDHIISSKCNTVGPIKRQLYLGVTCNINFEKTTVLAVCCADSRALNPIVIFKGKTCRTLGEGKAHCLIVTQGRWKWLDHNRYILCLAHWFCPKDHSNPSNSYIVWQTHVYCNYRNGITILKL